ncbi:hypothetical protein FALCPG4_008656 [Fusarium falciforme]
MLSFLRGSSPARTDRAAENPVIYENGASALEFRAAGSQYILRNTHPPFNKDSPSIMVPPVHYHIFQAEHFRIVSGECHLFRHSTDRVWKTLSAKDPKAEKTATISKKIYHTINNASTTEPLVLDVNLTPEDYEGEQRFFRNFFGYLDDCRKAEQAPSFFQMMVFLRSSDTPLAIPMPTDWLGLTMSKALMHAAGAWGKWVLGYQESYYEYYRA